MGSTTRRGSASHGSAATRVELFGGARIRGDRTVPLRGERQVGLISLLALHPERGLSAARMADELWDGRRVSDAALRVTVKRLRQRFVEAGCPDPVESLPGAYRLDLSPTQVDVWAWQAIADRTCAAVEAGDPERTALLAERAERLWVGPPFEGAGDVPSVAAEVERLTRLRVDVGLWRAVALLHRRDATAARRVLDEAVRSDPLREDLALARIVAAAVEGRRDLALQAYGELCDALADEVGIAPGSAVQDAISRAEQPDADPAALVELVVPPHWTGPAPVTAPAARSSLVDPPLVGRSALVDKALERLSRGGVVLLHGPPGCGRSRIAREVASRAAAAGLTVGSTSCARAELGTGPVLRLFGASAAQLTSGPPDPGGSPTSGEYQRSVFHARVASMLLARPGRSLMVVDDLQSLDHSGAQLLWHLVESDPDTGWLLCLRDGPRSDAASWLLECLDRASLRAVRRIGMAPLTDRDAADLVVEVGRSHGVDLDPGRVRAVLDAAGGWPALLVECTRQSVTGDQVQGASVIDHVIDGLLDQLGCHERDLMGTIALAGAPLDVAVLAAATGSGRDETAAALAALGGLQLAEPHDGRWSARDYVRPHVLARLDEDAARALHLRLATAVDEVGGDPVLAAQHLLLAGPDGDEALDAIAGPALRSLGASGSFEEARQLACAVLDRLGPASSTPEGLRTRVQIVATLIAGGLVDRAVALHDLIAPVIERIGDPSLRAASMAARGGIDTGGPERDRFVERALELIPQLPPEEVVMRVTLSTWAAHHLITAQRSATAIELLDAAEALTTEPGATDLRGIVLAVQYQAALNCDRTPEEADRAHRRVASWVAINPDPASEAMLRLLAVSQAGRNGTIDDHRRAVADLEELLEVVPRPDLRWSVAAATAAQQIALGDRERAAAAVSEAEQLGDRLHVGTAAGFARLHQLQLLHLHDQLAVLSPFLGRVVDPGESAGHHALDALAAEAAGDLERRNRDVALLRERTGPLFDNGTQWVLSAFLMGELAHRAGDALLGERVVDELQHHRGTGLTLLGLALLGSVDRTIGLAYAAMGDLRNAEAHLRAAVERDDAHGYPAFAELSRPALERLEAPGPGAVAPTTTR